MQKLKPVKNYAMRSNSIYLFANYTILFHCTLRANKPCNSFVLLRIQLEIYCSASL